jgi:hypothetical protein
LHDGKLIFLEERRERSERGMEAEEAVEIDRRIVAAVLWLGDGDARTQAVIIGFAEGDDDIETVGGAALEEDNELLLPC